MPTHSKSTQKNKLLRGEILKEFLKYSRVMQIFFLAHKKNQQILYFVLYHLPCSTVCSTLAHGTVVTGASFEFRTKRENALKNMPWFLYIFPGSVVGHFSHDRWSVGKSTSTTATLMDIHERVVSSSVSQSVS